VDLHCFDAAMQTNESTKLRGRPPEFDHEEALEKALQVFWAHGYEGASMAELTEAMGINRPSIYAAFGNKEALFRKALGKYVSGPVAYVAEALKEPTARRVVEVLLTKSAELLAGQDNPRGCMIVQGALTCGQGAEPIHGELVAYRNGYERALRLRFEQAQAEADLPRALNPSDLAKYVATIHQGMSVQASSGTTKEELLAVVRLVMSNWPTRV
jgi:AcrR family transcriptional regulator